MKLNSLENVLKFIKNAHAGQKYGNRPYHYHPIEVAMVVPIAAKKINAAKPVEDVMFAALLHDVVEDTEYTLDDLASMGVSERVIRALSLLTKQSNEAYMDYISRLLSATNNEDALVVKVADLLVNSSEKNLINLSQERQEKLRKKYSEALSHILKVK